MSKLITSIPEHIVNEIVETCSHAKVFNAGIGVVPPSLLIPADDPAVRKEITAYIADSYKRNNVIDSYTSVDPFYEISFDGTESDLNRNLRFIKEDAGDYSNKYKGVLAIDCIAFAESASQAQTFFNRFPKIADECVNIFFVPERPSQSESRFILKLLQNFNLKRFDTCPISTDGIILNIMERFAEKGIEIVDASGSGMLEIEKLISVLEIKSTAEAEKLINVAGYFTEITENGVCITAEGMRKIIGFYKEEKENETTKIY